MILSLLLSSPTQAEGFRRMCPTAIFQVPASQFGKFGPRIEGRVCFLFLNVALHAEIGGAVL